MEAIKRFFYTAGLTLLAVMGICEFIIGDCRLVFGVGAVLACVSLAAVLFALIFRHGGKKFTYVAVICIFAALGSFLWADGEFRYEKNVSAADGEWRHMVLQVTSDPGASVVCTAKIVSEDFSGPREVLLFLGGIDGISIYDQISGIFQFQALPKEDMRRNKVDNVIGSVFCGYSAEIAVESPNPKPFGYFFYRIRTGVSSTLEMYLGKQAAFAKGLMIGDKNSLDPGSYENLRGAGLLHVTAVSGLHVGIFTSILLQALSFVRRRKLKYGLCALCLFVLCGVCGFTPSILRAVLMMAVVFWGKLSGRKSDAKNTLGFVACLLLCIKPFLIASPSFLLSFLAALSIVTVYPVLEKAVFTILFVYRSYLGAPLGRNLISVALMSFCCSLFTAPVTYFFFQTVTFLGVVSGIFVIPMLSVEFLLCLVLILLGQVPFLAPLCRVLAPAVRLGVDYIMYIARLVSAVSLKGFDFAASGLTVPDAVVLALVLLTALAAVFVSVFLTVAKKREMMKKATGAVAVFSAALLCAAIVLWVVAILRSPRDEGLTVAFLDVGQGNCAVVFKEDFAAVFDCGGTLDPGGAAASYLREHGVSDIDYIFLSHLHDDHANGVSALCGQFPVGRIVLPATEGDAQVYADVLQAASKNGVPVDSLSADEHLVQADTSISIYTGQLDALAEDQNENSLIILFSYLDFDVLFTGDSTAAAEKRFVDRYGSVAADVFSAPHHGSATSSSMEFLLNTGAHISVISVGEGNSYGHPSAETVDRLAAHGSVYQTKDCGDIEIITDGRMIHVRTEKSIS